MIFKIIRNKIRYDFHYKKGVNYTIEEDILNESIQNNNYAPGGNGGPYVSILCDDCWQTNTNY